jgi:hypothetical protein
MVERHVAKGMKIVARQRDLIAELARRNLSTVEAERMLLSFIDIQSLPVEHLARLRASGNGGIK